MLTDAIGTIVRVNPAAEELLGWKACELPGKAIEEVQLRSPFLPATNASHLRMVLDHPCKGLASL